MGHTSELDAFLNIHKDQLISSQVPEHFWQTLYQKLVNQTFDAGNIFQIVKLDYDEKRQEHEPVWALQALSDISYKDTKHIYLIDHAWTYRVENAKRILREHDSLRERLCNMLDLDCSMEKKELAEAIFEESWKICNTYSIGNAENVEDRLPVWYIMDEIGTAVVHSDTPNCRIVPFIYLNEQVTYSVLFPIKDVEEDELIYRDFSEGITEPKRSALLLPWVPRSLEHISVTPPAPGPEYYLEGHVRETLPELTNFSHKIADKDSLIVFSQYDLVREHLTDNKFTIVEDEELADVLWYTQHFKDYKTLSETPDKFINQFPFEYVLTVKDLLCMTCRRRKSSEEWLPITYNLLTEICNFVSYFQYRQKEGLDNYWIVKPFNLARGLDTHITSNLNYIMRIAVTGPKIVQKYITDPVLFHLPERGGKVKFDIRYVVLVKSFKPLQAYVYKNFFLRFANKPFELNDFDEYEKHFTVMNYTKNVELKHMKCDEFKIKWESQYSHIPWNEIEQSIVVMLKNVLESATIEEPPCGIPESPQSRALYAADIMLEWTERRDIQVKLLEFNFTPDCKRACDYYPDFYNDIFNLLFFNKESQVFVTL